ncbi:MAG: isocitrate lyase/phosphoenolpyruvate mutase family protein [Sedimentitalea sp.]
MTQSEKAALFKSLHVKGDPLILYNIWDAGSAKKIAKEGAKAIATGSWSVASAQGFEDGEQIPMAFVLQIIERIARTVDVPVSLDFEGAYADDPQQIAKHIAHVIKTGAVGINFEDRHVQADGLFAIQTQAERIKAIRQAADDAGIALFINARTDVFLKADPATHKDWIETALEREAAYGEAGADGFFVPGLSDPAHIEHLVGKVNLPLNVMMMGPTPSAKDMAALGVSRISHGPSPYRHALKDLSARYCAMT